MTDNVIYVHFGEPGRGRSDVMVGRCCPGGDFPCAACLLGPIYDELLAEQRERDTETLIATLSHATELLQRFAEAEEGSRA